MTGATGEVAPHLCMMFTLGGLSIGYESLEVRHLLARLLFGLLFGMFRPAM